MGDPGFALAGPGAAGHEHHHDHGATDAMRAQMQTLLKRVPVKAQKAKNPVKDTPKGQAKAKSCTRRTAPSATARVKGGRPAAAGLPRSRPISRMRSTRSSIRKAQCTVVTNGWKESDAGIRQDDSETTAGAWSGTSSFFQPPGMKHDEKNTRERDQTMKQRIALREAGPIVKIGILALAGFCRMQQREHADLVQAEVPPSRDRSFGSHPAC